MDLRAYHVVLINTSAGKDSLAMLDHVYSLALAQEITGRLQAVHCDLGRMEWEGPRELAEQPCSLYGVPLHVISRSQDLLSQVEERGMWPSSTTRYCTSDHKVITHLVNAIATYGAQGGDLFISLIHTCELNGANPFDYLTELQRHTEELKANPSEWMPWNYRETLQRLTASPAA